MLFEIKKFKSFTGMEGPGFNADLHVDGRLAASVIDGGDGGEPHFRWTSKGIEAQVSAHIASLPAEPLEPDAEQWERDMYPNGRTWTLDGFMAMLIDRHETLRSLKRRCSKSILFVMPGMEPGQYFAKKGEFTPESKAAILARRPSAQFLNEHLEDGEWESILRP